MFRLIKWTCVAGLLSVGVGVGYTKLNPLVVSSGNPEGLKVEVRNNKCKLLSPDGKSLLELEADGKTFTIVSASASTPYGTQVQGNRVRILDTDGTTTLCDMDYNGSIITVTNVHGLKVQEVDVKVKMDRNTGTIQGIRFPKL